MVWYTSRLLLVGRSSLTRFPDQEVCGRVPLERSFLINRCDVKDVGLTRPWRRFEGLTTLPVALCTASG